MTTAYLVHWATSSAEVWPSQTYQNFLSISTSCHCLRDVRYVVQCYKSHSGWGRERQALGESLCGECSPDLPQLQQTALTSQPGSAPPTPLSPSSWCPHSHRQWRRNSCQWMSQYLVCRVSWMWWSCERSGRVVCWVCLCYQEWWVACGQPPSGHGTEGGTHYSRRHQEEPSQWGTPPLELLSLWLCSGSGIDWLEILGSCSGLQGRSTRLLTMEKWRGAFQAAEESHLVWRSVQRSGT